MTISTKMQDRKDLWKKLEKISLIFKLGDALGPLGHWKLRTEDGMFVPKNPAMDYKGPWIYTQQDPKSRCNLYHHVFFRHVGHIHSFCRSCWKVVARPRTLVELFDVYEIQKEMDVPCKLGYEPRENTIGLYGAYWYTRSEEEGLERYRQVRDLISERISPDVKVILKRYCTEYEIGGPDDPKNWGPSDKVGDVTQEERDMEEYVVAHFPETSFRGPQPDHLIASTMQGWIKWAYQHGDPTWKEFTHEPLLPSVVTYHEQVEENGTNT